VPFRLTRDIEDAMGASAVEGVYRRLEQYLSILVLTIFKEVAYLR